MCQLTVWIHGITCRKSIGRPSRHSTVNDLMNCALLLVEIPSKFEPTSLLPQPYILQWLSVAIQRDNAASLLKTVSGDSHDSNLDAVYYFVLVMTVE